MAVERIEDDDLPVFSCECCPPCPNVRPECEDGEQVCCNGVAAQIEWERDCHDNDDVPLVGGVEDYSKYTEGGSMQAPVTGQSPCVRHRKAAYARYSSVLAAIGCICKALIERNLESCCSPARRQQKKTARRRKEGSCCGGADLSMKSDVCEKENQLSGQKPEGDCCGQGREGGCEKTGQVSKKSSSCCDESCCDESSEEDACQKSCCEKEAGTYPEDADIPLDACKSSEEDGCCSNIKISDISTPELPQGRAISRLHDLEKGIQSDTEAFEQVTLSVSGLNCMGCENKLFRSLNAMHGIHNLQTSLVMSQAEFGVNSEAASVSDIIREVSKATGFSCHRIFTQDHSLDVLILGDVRNFIKQKIPYGVKSMIGIDGKKVRITYDAKLVGARDLLERTFNHAIALAPARPSKDLENGSNHLRKALFMTLFSALLTIPVLILAWAPLAQHEVAYGATSLALATIVQVVVAGPFYPSALKALIFTHVVEMDLLIVLSTSTAYIFSIVAFGYEISGRPLSVESFFVTSTLLVTLIMLGRLVSAYARHKAVQSISIRSLQASTALLVDDTSLGGREVDARLLQYGDVFKVMPDTRIPTDGAIVAGQSEVDESHITGEAMPVEKRKGSKLVAGSVNGSGPLTARLTRLPGENTISEIAAMVDAAKFSKPQIQQLADKVASIFVPVIVVLALMTFAVWIVLGVVLQHKSRSDAVVQAMIYAITVLIVSCPCAIGLAVPMVIVIAGGVGAKHGVVFRSAETLEIGRKVSHVIFDKTGTLTQGKMSVSHEEYLPDSNVPAASLVVALTMDSKHPVSIAVAKYLKETGVESASVGDVESVTGCGMKGVWEDRQVRVGSCRWLNVQETPQVAALLSQGLTVLCVSLDDELITVFGLDDTLRADAKSTVTELKERSIAVSLVSGDDDGAVQKIGNQLGIPMARTRSRCSPAEKQKYVKSITDGSNETVLFCGDGTNDAVALAQADIGLHMKSGTDVAQSAADAVLVRPTLSGILVLIDLSRAAFRRIIFNFVWSFIYNIFAILLAAGAFVRVRIAPQYAGLGELVSVLPVILIALQLRWFKSQ
ncbi:uncharacterized protein KY384_008141 [Bacidia gigantensis]|uniref:uncharacterized protein n=1 Tax=Bacidia gigantensis TaxID=2732470 RepID=UPI001D04067A|nr:uncharacterized protein KY384_008141 [Bacidia gigantensis]KAG8526712.1 hypothetical protein KY384_008141 [Bacidia gigantensis]